MENKKRVLVKAPEKTIESQRKQKSFFGSFRNMSLPVLLTIGILLCGTIALFTTIGVVAHNQNIRASQIEYEALQNHRNSNTGFEVGHGRYEVGYLSAFDVEMITINPDFEFWLRIDGTSIDYPVVRGHDNAVYLNTSFRGETSKAGTLFTDFRNEGLLSPHLIIYGHNLQQGGMFSDLRHFLNNEFLEEHKYITVVLNDEEITFEIFSARLTDIEDPAYNLHLSSARLLSRWLNRINAPLAATQVITLSTCTRGGSDDERIIVQGWR